MIKDVKHRYFFDLNSNTQRSEIKILVKGRQEYLVFTTQKLTSDELAHLNDVACEILQAWCDKWAKKKSLRF